MSDQRRARAPEPVSRIAEERAAKILERAAALDAEHNSEIEVDQLREAAAGAGISRAAFEEALAEQGGEVSPAEHRRSGSSVLLRDAGPPGFAMSDVTYYSGLLRDVLGEEGQVSVTDVIEVKDPEGVTASVSPSRSGVTATVTAEGRLRRRLLGMFWAVLPLLLGTFILSFDEDEFIIMFLGGLVALALAMIGASLSDRRERKALRKKVERIRRQLQRMLDPGPEARHDSPSDRTP